ncbi:50S ribosomal protein L10 [Fructilactobacillus fructivorans]|uniref:50S ribosomal protein L10 n=1 Tax=Fructilactobacillus fructivorans TaxID=1614 RepID=UPI00070F979D|nr:50S ribosomal protein L10 [Fructilactobacillus fructivorans]KRN40580.1 50S ribosomal protein L10 [Fructilactobacillus fructivorans]
MPRKNVIDAKAKKVDEVADQLQKAVSAIVVDYRGLSVAQDTDLRKQLRDNDVSMSVIKNKILERAADKADVKDLKDTFVGPTAVAFSDEDPVAPAKILKNFADDNSELEIKGGIIEGKIASLDEINEFAALPSREELLSTLANILKDPIRKVAYAVNAVVDKDDNGDDSDAA